jgi:hypothetical protein
MDWRMAYTIKIGPSDSSQTVIVQTGGLALRVADSLTATGKPDVCIFSANGEVLTPAELRTKLRAGLCI